MDEGIRAEGEGLWYLKAGRDKLTVLCLYQDRMKCEGKDTSCASSQMIFLMFLFESYIWYILPSFCSLADKENF